MKRLAIATLAVTLVLTFSAVTRAEKSSEESAIRATITDYIEAYYTGDAARMEKSLHPHYLKHTISGPSGAIRMTEKTGLQMVQDVRVNGVVHVSGSQEREQIAVLDVTGDIASAKLVTAHWTDYIALTKWNGEWKIVSVVLRENE